MTRRLRSVLDQAGAGQEPILDHAAAPARPVLDGLVATSLAIDAPGVHLKNLGPGVAQVRSDGPAAAAAAPQCYPLDPGEEWDFWFDGDGGTLSLFGPAGTTLSVIPYKWTTVG